MATFSTKDIEALRTIINSFSTSDAAKALGEASSESGNDLPMFRSVVRKLAGRVKRIKDGGKFETDYVSLTVRRKKVSDEDDGIPKKE